MPAGTNNAANVLIVGVGGQGIIRCSKILAEVVVCSGLDVKKSEIHGLSQRGGSVTSHVRWGEQVFTPVIPEGQADVLLAMEELEALRYAHVVRPDGVIYVNDFSILPRTVISGDADYPQDIDGQLRQYAEVRRIPATEIARELGDVRMSNVALLGSLSQSLDFPTDVWIDVISESFPEKFVEPNCNAFRTGATFKPAEAGG
ncbi:MAG: indolepyruvate oxidoreductase subunit beta [bacterium]|nr:indolepyruvate oxidoreductase subunit beta [bacterium]